MDAFTSLYVWQMMYLQMRLYDENFGEKFSSYRRMVAQISIWDNGAEVCDTTGYIKENFLKVSA